MHANASMAFNNSETVTTLGTILSIQPRTAGGGGGKSTDEIVSDMAVETLDKLPEILDVEKAHKTTFVYRGEVCIITASLSSRIV